MATKTKTRTIPPSQLALLEAEESARGWRETIESVVVAIILALLFRTFLAEAFVIPTGSMAPTLMGDHKDVQCFQCKYWYQSGAAARSVAEYGTVTGTVCPMCRNVRPIDEVARLDDATFTGDRILVNKFSYEIGEPQRWDVIVFRYPGNAKQNYIKRLIGLPNEKVKIRHGDIYTQGSGDADFVIRRKDAGKLVAMLQAVHDTNHLAPDLIAAGWPSRWDALGTATDANWKVEEDGHRFAVAPAGDAPAWLRYRHYIPEDWEEAPAKVSDLPRAQLIRDFYAYNATLHNGRSIERGDLHWVGDLALEAEVKVESDTGLLLLDLVEGGRHYECKIDVKTGQATLSIDGGRETFDGDVGGDEGAKFRIAATSLRGQGSYSLRFANCDDRLYLWVNGSEVSFAHATTYKSPPDLQPYYRTANARAGETEDLGDLAPLGIGSQGAKLTVSRLKVLRDVYYVATEVTQTSPTSFQQVPEYRNLYQDPAVMMNDPAKWPELFGSRGELNYTLGPDQFMPLGDNSPASSDARLWSARDYSVYDERRPVWREPFVRRELLTGKAFAVYWPHCWYVPIASTNKLWPLTPNPSRMQRIK